MVNENIEKIILDLYSEQKWEEIVNLNCDLYGLEKNRLFWVLPTLGDLRWMNEITRKYNVRGLASIGCGCGLLEWLFQKYSGLDVIGVELDKSWWSSKYSPPLFLEKLIFIQEDKTRNFCVSDSYALLFCYFNNGAAFSTYIENYDGNLVFVIGPRKDQNRWTDPLPFDEKFAKHGWKLIAEKEIERTTDCIAAYSR